VIGVSLQVGAERIGDPAVLYVAMVHPEGPAHKAGLAHGDEVLTVDGTTVSGKSYEQIVRMIRGEVGTVVKLGVKGEGPAREIAITRIASDQLPMGPRAPHGSAK
jgi:C-terminal processing protease CtpA/Prc